LSGLSRFWKAHGEFVANRPLLVIIISLIVVGLASIWIYRLQIDSDPETLWVPPNSRAAQDKQYFDAHFGPFYRINMMIITQNRDYNHTVSIPQL
jgi:Niemann-Pick C1 protein